MIILRLLSSLALPLLLGYAIAIIIANKTSVLEKFGLAWGIGIGLLGIEMFTLSLLGLPVDLVNSTIPALLAVMVLAAYLMMNKKLSFDPKPLIALTTSIFKTDDKQDRWKVYAEKILIALTGLTVLYVFFDALVKPIVNFDDLWRQGSIARIIFETGHVITKQTLDLAGPHPFLNPLSQAWIYLGIGAWNDALGKIIFALCFASLIFIFYANLRKDSSRLFSLFFTYLLTSFPLIVYHAGTAYSDFMQTFYYTVGAIYLFRFMKDKSKNWLYVSALFLGIGNFVKQSGIPLWGIAVIVLFIYLFAEGKKDLKAGALSVLLSAAISLPWLLYQNSFLMRYLTGLGQKIGVFSPAAIVGAEAGAAPNLLYGSPTLLNISYQLGKRLFTYADWQLLWFVFILALLFFWQNIYKSKLKYLLLLILLDLVMVIYAFYDNTMYQFLVDGTLVERVMMYQIPVVLYFVAIAIRLGRE